ncbi:hypothetical protein ACFXPA_42200 [Amycolatopsis sp. NPDC059090]|uniref:hypothetical protein n=1 Tax=Amycolatopsis sp. NPDC059090 TaxID=3346723 RepID=UPI0036711A11
MVSMVYMPEARKATVADYRANLIAAAERYLTEYGWRTQVIDNQLMLPFDGDLIGVSIPAGRAGELNHQLAMHRLSYPVVALPTPRHRWVFLASCTAASHYLPTAHFVALLRYQDRIPLPPSQSGSGQLRWVVEPPDHSAAIPEVGPLLKIAHLASAAR